MNLAIAVLLTAAAAGEADYPRCDQAKADQGIQSAMTICAHRDFLEADSAMNAQWAETAKEMKNRDLLAETFDDGRPGYFEALLDAQRKWIAFRDAQCVSEGYYARGGSMEPMLVGLCKAQLTRERAEQLRDLVEI